MTHLPKIITFLLLLLAISTLAQIQKGLDIDGEAPNDRSGWSVSMNSDGNTVAIGANGNDDAGNNAGHVRVYYWDDFSWTQKGSDINGEAEDDSSGSSVALSNDGNTIAIGAHNNNGSGSGAGHVRVYYWDGLSWIQKGADIDGEDEGDHSGSTVSISSDGNTVAIGAPYNAGLGFYAGHVRVYFWDGLSWIQKGMDIDGEATEDECGYSVSLSSDGNTVAIGARYNDGIGIDAGHTRVYRWDGSSWIQKGSDIDGEAAGDFSGWSVSISSDGNVIAIGAPNNAAMGPQAGHVRIYSWDGSAWLQKGIDIDAVAENNDWGWSVSLNSDGTTVAVGAIHNSDSWPFSGRTCLYKWNGTVWQQKGSEIDGTEINERSGYSVSISADGNILAIGAPYKDNAGHARVFEFCTETINTDVTLIDIDTLQAENGGVGISYQWIDCKDSSAIDGATFQTYGASTNGNYAVIINQDGCVDTSECTAITDIGLGISKNPIEEITIYPNPSSGIVYIQSANTEIESIKLYNSLGQLVMSWNVTSTNAELNLKNFERGVYSLVIETSEGLVRKQIILN